MKVQKRYTPQFKEQAVELVKLGKPVSEVARELGIGDGILYNWVKLRRDAEQLGNEGVRAEGSNSEVDELLRLRRENAKLKLENDILKKAAIILGSLPLPNNAR